MLSLDTPIEEITEASLNALITDQTVEWRTIEYKEELPGGGDGERKEFASDISSFANTSGGHILYGITAVDGVPTGIKAMSPVSADEVVLRLESMIRDNIFPRIPGIASRVIPISTGGYVFVVRIPRSWSPPHMVDVKGSRRFCGRGSNGKYDLSIEEIRSLVTLSESTSDRLRNFRVDRVFALDRGDAPVPVTGKARVMMHLAPVNAFSTLAPLYDLSNSSVTTWRQPFITLDLSASGYRHNFDGYLAFDRDRAGTGFSGYAQLFRNGIVEAVDGDMIHDKEKYIPSTYFEEHVLLSVWRYLSLYQDMGVVPPIVVMLSLLGVQDYRITISSQQLSTHGIDRNALLIPEVLVQSLDQQPHTFLKPIFDSVWNACGYDRSLGYDEQGNWTGQGGGHTYKAWLQNRRK